MPWSMEIWSPVPHGQRIRSGWRAFSKCLTRADRNARAPFSALGLIENSLCRLRNDLDFENLRPQLTRHKEPIVGRVIGDAIEHCFWISMLRIGENACKI